MTLTEAIAKIDTLKPNIYSDSDKVSWLSELDGIVKEEIFDTHTLEEDEEPDYEGYNDDTDLDTTELIIKSPYDSLYIVWLEAQIDYHNAEYIKYNNSMTRFNDQYQAYANHFNRTHMPKGTRINYW